MALGDDCDGQGPDHQLAAFVGDFVVVRHILVAVVENTDSESILGRAVPHVGDLKQGIHLGLVTVHERRRLADGVAAPAMSLTVVDPVHIVGNDRDGSGIDDQLAALVGDLVIFGYLRAGRIRNSHRDPVCESALPHVGDLGQGQGFGSVAVHQGSLLADGMAAPAMGGSVVGPGVIIG